jgi:hypothetical protein
MLLLLVASGLAIVFGLLWMLNGWFQGMGFPPCARLLAHWFPPKQLASRMSIWNISHSIGGGLIVILCGYLVVISWRLAFFVPAAIAFVCVIFIWFTLPDTPSSVGLPEVEGTQAHSGKHESRAEFRDFVIKRVFLNKYIWIVSLANFFVYIVRYAVLDWGPTMLTGSCLCGGIAYEADAPLERIVHCHCRTCRKTHGAAFSSVTAVPRENFRWVRGRELLGAFESSPGKFRRFCTRCGSHLMAERTAQPVVLLRLGCLDTKVADRPQVHIWRSDAASWYDPKAQFPEKQEGLA